MKPILMIVAGILCFAFLLSFVGCSDKTEPAPENTFSKAEPAPENTFSPEVTKVLSEILGTTFYDHPLGTVVYDIDGDGIDETVKMVAGRMSGLFSCYLVAETEGNVKYVGEFLSYVGQFLLSEDEPGKLLLYGDSTVVEVFDMNVKGDWIIIEKDGEEVGQDKIVNMLQYRRDNPTE